MTSSLGSIGKVGFSKAMAAGWIALDKAAGKVVRKADAVDDAVKANLCAPRLEDLAPAVLAEYKKRKLLQETQVKSYVVSKGPNFTTSAEKGEADLTADLMSTGAWKTAKFKPYNFDAMGVAPPTGHLHPLLKVSF